MSEFFPFKYEQDGVAFFCVEQELTYTVYLAPVQEIKPPELLARLYVKPTPELFIAICRAWIKAHA